ncbi:helix-turn-helix domain-containing protein [Anaerofustis stercorihominis]|uniref:helix-turn-helix domain-containing protein n=1 Tax=Anaerofustis stercorihominis TaxID=214853 RepID=UPI0015F31A0E|nr:helix-turn-helix transcriptional regulator [Anaerofustis stercorihominis]
MNINEIIKNKRVEAGLTQENVANYLGVSTPAVNKWEKGVSYPDITLLPPIARLFNIDMNTLLSFNEDLSEKEIGSILNKVSELMKDEGFEAGYEYAMSKIREYPSGNSLILNIGFTLEGGLVMSNTLDKKDEEFYRSEVIKLYERVLNRNDEKTKVQVSYIMILRYINENELDKAEELMKNIPDYNFDKDMLKANLYIKKEEKEKAYEILERKIMSLANDIQTVLLHMIELSLGENKYDEAAYFSSVSYKTAELFDLWEYNKYASDFQICIIKKDIERTISLLENMLPAMLSRWDISSSPLYRHIERKANSPEFAITLLETFINEVKTDKELSYLNESKKFWDLIKKYYNK